MDKLFQIVSMDTHAVIDDGPSYHLYINVPLRFDRCCLESVCQTCCSCTGLFSRRVDSRFYSLYLHYILSCLGVLRCSVMKWKRVIHKN